MDRPLRIWLAKWIPATGNVPAHWSFTDPDKVRVWGRIHDAGYRGQGLSEEDLQIFYLEIVTRWTKQLANQAILGTRVEVIGEPISDLTTASNPLGLWRIDNRQIPASGNPRRRTITYTVWRRNHPLTGV